MRTIKSYTLNEEYKQKYEEDSFVCADCNTKTSSFYEYRDDHRHLTICENCFNIQFAIRETTKDIEWFENNFNNPEKEFPKLKFLKKIKKN